MGIAMGVDVASVIVLTHGSRPQGAQRKGQDRRTERENKLHQKSKLGGALGWYSASDMRAREREGAGERGGGRESVQRKPRTSKVSRM